MYCQIICIAFCTVVHICLSIRHKGTDIGNDSALMLIISRNSSIDKNIVFNLRCNRRRSAGCKILPGHALINRAIVNPQRILSHRILLYRRCANRRKAVQSKHGTVLADRCCRDNIRVIFIL